MRVCTNQTVGHKPQRFAVVGVGHSVDLTAFRSRSGWASCFVGAGVGEAPIASSDVSKPLSIDAEVVDGTFRSDVLVLVHLSGGTTTAVLRTAHARSRLLAAGDGFEVLELPTTGWPHWHAPWRKRPVTLGRLTGYDRGGQATHSVPFTWCAGNINPTPGGPC